MIQIINRIITLINTFLLYLFLKVREKNITVKQILLYNNFYFIRNLGADTDASGQVWLALKNVR
jgi:hypothetical protein